VRDVRDVRREVRESAIAAAAPPALLRPALIAAGLVLALLLVRLVVTSDGGGRIAILASVALPLVVLALADPPAALAVVLVFLPFMGGIRRLIYLVSPYTSFDPILLIAPAITTAVAVYVITFRADALRDAVRRSRLSKWVVALLVVFVLQMLNPLQRSPAVALSGAMYYLVPLCWFIFGTLALGPRIQHIVPTAIVIGVLAATYGLYQAYAGFPWFDRYWMEHGGYTSLSVAGGIRQFSFFMNEGDYVQFISSALAAALIYAIRARRAWPLLAAPLLFWGMMVAGTRGAVGAGAIAVLVTLLVLARSGRARVAVVAGALAALPVIVAGLTALPQLGGQHGQVRALLEHQSKGLLNPGQSTVAVSLLPNVTMVLKGALFSRPWGTGLGSTTLGAAKFSGSSDYGGEIDVSSIAASAGVPGFVAYLAVVALTLWRGGRAIRDRGCGAAEAAGFAFVVCSLGYWLNPSGYGVPCYVWLLAGAHDAVARRAETANQAEPDAAAGVGTGEAAGAVPAGLP
jgi:hypothetical protein